MTYLIALAMTLGPLVTLFNEATRVVEGRVTALHLDAAGKR